MEFTNCYEDLIFKNNLILKCIFKNLNKKELLPLRLVSPACNEAAIDQISKTLTVYSSWAQNWETQFHYFKKLRIKNVHSVFNFGPRYQDELREQKKTFAKLLENGDQILKLTISSLQLKSDEDFSFFIGFLSKLRNLRTLVLVFPDICVERFSEHNFERIFPSVREVKIGENKDPNLGLIVSNVTKLFPNLTTNLGHVFMDLELLRSRVCRRIVNYEIDSETYENFLTEMNFLISEKGEMRVRKLVISNIDSLPKAGLDCISEILRKLSDSLEILELTCCNYPTHLEKRETIIPPLRKLRKLVLGFPCSFPDYKFTKLTFVWNVGKSFAKDFPSLEYFNLLSIPQKYSIFKKPSAWALWEPFLPIETDGVELEPFKFLKYVDLALPQNWIGRNRQLPWGRKVANCFSRIYNNAGNGSMTAFIDWVERGQAMEKPKARGYESDMAMEKPKARGYRLGLGLPVTIYLPREKPSACFIL